MKSEKPVKNDKPKTPFPGEEDYSYAVTRKLFTYTLVGTILFSGIMVALWYLM